MILGIWVWQYAQTKRCAYFNQARSRVHASTARDLANKLHCLFHVSHMLGRYVQTDAEDEGSGEASLIAAMLLLRGKAYNALENQQRAKSWYIAAIQTDPFCYEAFKVLNFHLSSLMIACSDRKQETSDHVLCWHLGIGPMHGVLEVNHPALACISWIALGRLLPWPGNCHAQEHFMFPNHSWRRVARLQIALSAVAYKLPSAIRQDSIDHVSEY